MSEPHDSRGSDARAASDARAIGEAFVTAFGRPPDGVGIAPGRVNLLGEHTDYNGGFVLPTVIPQRARVAIALREDRRAHVRTQVDGAPVQEDSFEVGEEARRGSWIDYIQGVTASLAQHGHRAQGFDAWIDSDVPPGAGLSSSAALEVAVLRALRVALDLRIDDVALAELAKWGENEVVGAPVGILDPMACSLGSSGFALFLDTRTFASSKVEIPSSIELVVVDSGVPHDHGKGDYRVRRAECEEAARLLGVAQLRDLEDGDLSRARDLPAPLGARVRHVVTENARVLKGVEAMRRGDAAELGRLFYESHASMRDDYDVSIPEIDALVERARAHQAAIGARLTGGGFGGAIVALAQRGQGARLARDLASSGGRALVPRTA
jgi:galactokinase